MMQPSLPPPSSSSRDVNGNNDGNSNDNDKPQPCSSIFDAIKEGDWEGLLTLYATTAYDAVHSAEFARQGSVSGSGSGSGSGNTNIDSSFHRQHNSPPFFRDEKKMEVAASFQGYNNNNNNKNKASSLNLPSSSSVIRELDAVVREIIGAELFDEHHNSNGNDESDNNDIVLHNHETTTSSSSSSTKSTTSTSHNSNEDSHATHQLQGHTTNQHTNKKTRLHQYQHSSSSSSPSTRKSPPGGGSSSSLDHILSHGHHHHHHPHSTHHSTTHQYLPSSSTSLSSPPSTPNTGRAAAARRRSSNNSNSTKGERIATNTTITTATNNTMDWEKIMWNSAATLSNTRPTPSFVVHLSDRDRREEEDGERGANGSSNNGSMNDGVNRALHESTANAAGVAEEEEGVSTTSTTPHHDDTHDDDSDDDDDDDDDDDEPIDEKERFTPIFEGNVANATPPDHHHHHHHHNNMLDNNNNNTHHGPLDANHANATNNNNAPPPGGSGTAQHLACLLDSPFALAILIVAGVDCTARHTAFRRLAVHEAACADSPQCLGLLMEVGRSGSSGSRDEEAGGGGAMGSERIWDPMDSTTTATMEGAGDRNGAAAAASSSSMARLYGLKSSSAHSFLSSSSFAAASAGFDSFGSEQQFARGTEGSVVSSGMKKPSKKKLNLFSGWNHKGNKTSGAGNSSSGAIAAAAGCSSNLKKSSSPAIDQERQQCEATTKTPPSPNFTSFPAALKVMWDAVKLLRSGLINESDAARHVLDRVKVSDRATMALELQCPHPQPTNVVRQQQHQGSCSEAGAGRSAAAARSSSPTSTFASIPGLSSAVHQLFQQQPNNNHHHRNHNVRDNAQPPQRRSNVDGHGNTPLHWAAFKNSVRAMDVLLSCRSNDDHDIVRQIVNVRAHPSGWTPLHDAAYSDAADAVSRLIAAGADVDARSHSGATPLCFAAQEDAPNATRGLLEAGANPAVRCLGNSPGVHVRANNADNAQFHSRFSGYTPLHYCAHYNAARAARVLLEHETNNKFANNNFRHGNGHRGNRDRSLSHPLPATTTTGSSSHNGVVVLLEIPDLNEKLPIHVAVARGSSRVLRELLHGGARLERTSPARARAETMDAAAATQPTTPPVAIPERSNPVAAAVNADNGANASIASLSNSPNSVTSTIHHHHASVSSPVLRAMIPSQPIQSSKPWNCLSQKSIDACRLLIKEAELNWTPGRHILFAPVDRAAVVEVLRVGKRLERIGLEGGLTGTEGRGVFLDLWPRVLSFCGRGWFEHDGKVEQGDEAGEQKPEGKVVSTLKKNNLEYMNNDDGEEISMQCSSTSSRGGDSMEEEFTQFQLDEASDNMAAII